VGQCAAEYEPDRAGPAESWSRVRFHAWLEENPHDGKIPDGKKADGPRNAYRIESQSQVFYASHQRPIHPLFDLLPSLLSRKSI